MKGNDDFIEYMNGAIRKLLSDLFRSALRSPRQAAFLLRYRGHNARSLQIRSAYEAQGIHIPFFLISSISDSCNLFCTGCYARANGLCGKSREKPGLSVEEWKRVFDQAAELGIPFHLLAGGEPLLRRDVLLQAAQVKNTLFPIFTNGTLIDDFYQDLFDIHRNLIPILSMEGSSAQTDQRRGDGIYDTLVSAMRKLGKRGILFGVSLTVTTQNLEEITSASFMDELYHLGCRLLFFVEYVPVDAATRALAPTEKQRRQLETRLEELRTRYKRMIFLSFPGDEQALGGCLAAGRGFFHINPYGDVEACPFSPYSDRNVRTHALLEVLQSPFFQRLKEEGLVGGEHSGGCALFEQEETVRALLDMDS